VLFWLLVVGCFGGLGCVVVDLSVCEVGIAHAEGLCVDSSSELLLKLLVFERLNALVWLKEILEKDPDELLVVLERSGLLKT
jgi:hypothetical protein